MDRVTRATLDSVARDLTEHPWVAVATSIGPDLDLDQTQSLVERAGGGGHGGDGNGRSAVGLVTSLLLRRLLGHITDVEPSSLSFEIGTHGKPALAGAPDRLHFNVSHTGSHGVIALSNRFEIGVDAETISDYKRGVARRILSPRSFDELDGLDEIERTLLFYRMWVIKEACVKATGAGFSTPLEEVDVGLRATQGHWGPVEWQLIDVADDACACIALLVNGDGNISDGLLHHVNIRAALELG